MIAIADVRHLMPRNANTSVRYPIRDISRISYVVVHHSLTTSGSARAYANYHISPNGWPGIAYHYVINKDGSIDWTLDWDQVGYHAGAANFDSIGICLTGNFDIEEPTAEQLDALTELILFLRGRINRNLGIKPHNAFSTKSCPGNNFSIEEVKRRVEGFTQPPLSQLLTGANPQTLILSAGLLFLFLKWKKP